MANNRAPIKLSSVVDPSRYAPLTATASLTVAVRARPLIRAEIAKGGRRDIIRVLDNKVVLVLDPDDNKEYLDQVQNRTKEKRYTFDVAFDSSASNRDVYLGTVHNLISGVLQGLNTTVFAYGATGSGKTYTMVGAPGDPGLMVLSLERVFQERDALPAAEQQQFEVECSYLEVYNEVIYDLLIRSSPPLELREDPQQGVQVAGLKRIKVTSAAEIMSLLEDGNRRRKTEATDANASSSRSHAVLEIGVRRTPGRNQHYKVSQLRGKLALVDLAGSERAAETNNAGQKLRDGANINRSLLALANCINALGKTNQGKAASYVPYRNSKLTRLLKDGLSGNSRTAMISTVSGSSDQYHHSINTLKYADRAKEIKTHVVQNMSSVESHVADYQHIIDNLQGEVQDLRSQLMEQEAVRRSAAHSNSRPRTAEEDLLSVIGRVIEEMGENIEERINLQKALFEIEDANVYNKHELRQLDEFLESGSGAPSEVMDARTRRAEVTEAMRDNEKEKERYKADIVANEATKKDIQARVQSLVSASGNSSSFLNLLSTFRLQALGLQELKFQMAVREQIIGEQKEVIANLWKILDKSGMQRERVLEVARSEGIIMEGLLQRGRGPPSVGAVPLSEALQAVRKEGFGFGNDGKTSPLPMPYGRGKGQPHDRQAGGPLNHYRRWPGMPGMGGKAASADATPIPSSGSSSSSSGGSEDGDGDGHGHDGAMVVREPSGTRSDKSPLRQRGRQSTYTDGCGPGAANGAARPGLGVSAAAVRRPIAGPTSVSAKVLNVGGQPSPLPPLYSHPHTSANGASGNGGGGGGVRFGRRRGGVSAVAHGSQAQEAQGPDPPRRGSSLALDSDALPLPLPGVAVAVAGGDHAKRRSEMGIGGLSPGLGLPGLKGPGSGPGGGAAGDAQGQQGLGLEGYGNGHGGHGHGGARHGRRRHTDAKEPNGWVGEAGGGGGGGGYGAELPLHRVRSDVGRDNGGDAAGGRHRRVVGVAAGQQQQQYLPPPQAPLQERLARLKGKLSKLPAGGGGPVGGAAES